MSVTSQLNAFEKFLTGKKTYITSAAGILYGVFELGLHQKNWTSWGGALTYIFSGATIASLRAALAEIKLALK